MPGYLQNQLGIETKNDDRNVTGAAGAGSNYFVQALRSGTGPPEEATNPSPADPACTD